MIRQPIQKNQAMQVILSGQVEFEHPHRDIGVAKIRIASASWVCTNEGIVVIDTLLNPGLARKMKAEIAETGRPVKYVIYTHGHRDHVGGASIFADDHPQFIGQRLLPERLHKYEILKEHYLRINAIQFNLPMELQRGLPPIVQPTIMFDESMVFQLGEKTFELYHARAETDDAAWVYVPEVETVFVGDLIIAGYPNIGNPWKPTRFALSWARALEEVRAKSAALLIAHGGQAVYQGRQAVKELLDANIEGIYSIHDQVVDGINKDIPVAEMIHAVKLPDHLRDNKALQFIYSRPEFAVYNIYRWYHGYFDNNPANLLPRPESEVNREIYSLIGDPEAILKRAQTLLTRDQAQLALQVLDILLKQEPDHVAARELHLEILEKLCEADYCLMSRNAWVYFMEKDRELLKKAGSAPADSSHQRPPEN